MLRGEISTLRAAIAYGQDDAEEMEHGEVALPGAAS